MFNDALRLLLTLNSNGAFHSPKSQMQRLFSELPEALKDKIHDVDLFLEHHAVTFRFGLCCYMANARINFRDADLVASIREQIPSPHLDNFGFFTGEETEALKLFNLAIMEAGYKRKHIK